MKIIAGLDIKNGKVVQLSCHDEKIISDCPVKFCLTLKEKGIKKLHIVDLDGVFSGQTVMFDLLKEIKEKVDLPIQFGGGIRSLAIADRIISLGIDEIVIGTSAVNDQELLIQLLEKYPQQVIVAADVYKDVVYTEGWESNSSTSIKEFLNTLQLIHVPHVLITDISKNGTLAGIDTNFIEPLLAFDQLKISLSGGIQSDDDLANLKRFNLHSVVVTSAIIENLATIS